MKFNLKSQAPRLLLAAGMALGFAAAHAAGGYTVLPRQEALVKPGMTTDEVMQALGRPVSAIKFRNEPGPLWTYNVSETAPAIAVFEVSFGPDGKVISTIQHDVPSSADGSGAN